LNWKGWLLTVSLLVLVGWLAFVNGLFMHGD